MGLFDRFIRTRSADNNILTLSALLGGVGKITPEQAMAVPAFASCVDFVSNTVASLPVRLYRNEADGSTAEITKDKRLRLLNCETGDLLDGFQLKKAMATDYLKYGNTYVYVKRRRNEIAGLYYVDTRHVNVNINADPIIKVPDIRVNGTPYHEWDFVIATRQTKNGVTGIGLIDENQDVLATAYNTLLFENKLVRTNGNKRGFLSSDSKLDETALTKLKKAWKDLYGTGDENLIILNNGLKFQEASSTSVEMQLNEIKQSNNDDICKLFGIPKTVLNGGGNESDYLNAIKIAVMPILSAFQRAFDKVLLLENEKDSLFFEFDTSELTKGDLMKRSQAYVLAVKNGWMTVDEVRAKENMPPLGLDYIRLGLQDVLFDPQSNLIYTPNTNQTVKLDAQQINKGGSIDGKGGEGGNGNEN